MNKKLSDVLELPIKIDVSSLTEEERGELQKELFSVGVSWNPDGRKEVGNLFARYYFISGSIHLTWSNGGDWFITHFNKEISIQQLKEKIKMCKSSFSKSDLKDGMVVKYRGGCIYSNNCDGLALVVGETLVQATEFNYLTGYSEDLLAEHFQEFDIVEVFEVIEACSLKNINTQWKLKSIWKREELSERDKQIISIREKMLELEKQLETLQDTKQQ